MIIAEMMSQEGKWREVIPYLEKSLAYTRGDESKIAEAIGWLGTAYLRSGQFEKATEQFLTVTREHSDQIGLAFRAYGNLVKHAREQGEDEDLERYVNDVERYARSLIRKGKDKEYPLLYTRMSQIMTMAGRPAEAQEWTEAQAQ